jgi:hypothetical protein
LFFFTESRRLVRAGKKEEVIHPGRPSGRVALAGARSAVREPDAPLSRNKASNVEVKAGGTTSTPLVLRRIGGVIYS